MAGALNTDLYELTMASSYLRRGMTGRAVFSLFVRRLPARRGFLVAAGLEACLDHLETFVFSDADLTEVRRILDVDASTLAALRELRFTGDVRAVPEGRVVLAGEPLLEVSAPIAQAQLVETQLLNSVTFATAVASKAARFAIAAQGRGLVEFGLRRTQGLDAALAVVRGCAMAGFAATSNVEAGRRLGVPVSGTMAHSFVEAFPTEREAFAAFATDHPVEPTFLVDTYDIQGGVRAAIEVARRAGLGERFAVRIDSGDLAAESRRARALLDAAGVPGARIVVSGSLDEDDVEALVRGGAPVDGFGVGTRLAVVSDAPYLDTVYKLVEYAGRPVLKLSADKATAPGAKQVYRHADFGGDVVALAIEPPPPGMEPLLVEVMRDGRRLRPADSLAEGRRRLSEDLARLPASALRLRDPQPPPVTWSSTLAELDDRVRAEAADRARGASRP